MRKKYFIIIAIIVLIVAAWVYHLFTANRPGLAGVNADISINAVDLYNQFQSDENTADKKYLDKVIEIKGTITDIQQTDTTLSIELKGADMGGINCGIASDGYDKALSFKKEATITVKGRCSGFLMDVNMVDCIIEK